MKKAFLKLSKTIGILIYSGMSMLIITFAGCANMMPTRVPPLTTELGYTVLNYKGWTTVGLNTAAYRFEVEKLKMWKVLVGLVNDPALALHGQVVNWLGAASTAGLLGGGPLLLKMVPKGAVKKEDHDRLVEEALHKSVPED